MLDRSTIEKLSHAELVELVITLVGRIEQLEADNQQLRAELDELKRRGKRQAAPFAKDEPKSNPKPPGRKPGHGPFTRRSVPPTESFTSMTDVLLDLEQCPECGTALQHDAPELVSITELPELPKPEIHGFLVHRAHCATCRRSFRARDRRIADDQRGATAHRLGLQLKAVACWMQYQLGIPVRKLPVIFKDLFGLDLTQSALTQSAAMLASGSLAETYQQLRAEIARSPRVHSDDTGWSVNRRAAWLMNFSTDSTVVYQIRHRHRSQELREVLGERFEGVLECDRFTSYDALATVRQQKCVAHILRNLSEHLQRKRARARTLGLDIGRVFTQALALHQEYHHSGGNCRDFAQRANELRQELTHLLRDRPLKDRDNQRLVDELGWHHDRGNLLRFLDDPSIEPTNNQAERDLRGAVIARKVSHCSKSWPGAETRSIFMSVLQTLKRRSTGSIAEALRAVLSGEAMPQPATR
jgi:transposase